MKKIELSADEIKVIKQQINGEIEISTATEEQQVLLTGVIDKAEALLDELDAYDEMGDDLIKWFYGKYESQAVSE